MAEVRNPMSLQIEKSQLDDAVILKIDGELDVHTGPELRQEIQSQLGAQPKMLIVDLNGVGMVDSTGLGVLIGGCRRAKDAGTDLRVVCDNTRVKRILDISGLSRLFRIEPDVEAALADGG
jgi:anti-sigma B factor antagonist